MYSHAAGQRGQVLIAGHTHHPVWQGMSFEQAMATMAALGAQPQIDETWLREQVEQGVPLPGSKPCYFNTGCCCFGDRSITGIEIEDGQIRLVRWEVFAEPVRTAMFAASLRDVFAAVA